MGGLTAQVTRSWPTAAERRSKRGGSRTHSEEDASQGSAAFVEHEEAPLSCREPS
jgi:hypothetical protein